MASTKERDLLEFGVFVDIRDSLKVIEKFQRRMDTSMREIAKSSDFMGAAAEKAAQRATHASEEQEDAIVDVAKAYKKQGTEVTNVGRTLEALKKLAAKAHGDEKKALEDEIATLEKIAKTRDKVSGGAKPKKGGLFFGDLTPQKVADKLREAGEALKEPLQNFLQKDAKGLFESSFKLGGRAFVKSMGLGTKGLMSGGAGLRKLGGATSTEGKLRGGAAGGMMRLGGGGMKAMGAVMEKMGKSLDFLTKLGPIFGLLSSSIVGLLKLFIDADSMVKEFNKDILSSASNAEIFARAGGDAQTAMVDMDNTLQGLRDAALDFKTNMALGITKEEHKAVVNVLTQEGVSLGRINDEAELAGKSVRELATQLTTTGVAYSRAFGVPLQEINQLQAQMMTEMGRSVGETQQSFAMMTRAATESGIASNKFFAMIRGVSADLSLYNLRLEDSVALLSKLGQVMSPEHAQKFLQSAMSMAKGMGRQQKLQMGFFVGAGKLNKIVSKDIERDSKNLMAKISAQAGIPADVLQDAFSKEGTKGLTKFLDNVPKEAKGAIMESIMDLQLKQSSAKKGIYGQSQAIGDLGPGAFLEALNEAVTRFSPGQKSIADLRGSIGLEQTAEALGISQEQVDQMAKLQLAVDMQRDALLKQAEGNAAETKRIQEMTTGDIINGFSEDMKKDLKLTKDGLSLDERMEGMAKEQGQRTQSIQQKLENLVDWFMGAFYDVILGMWDAILSIPGVGNDEDEKRVADLRRVRKYGANEELTGIAKSGNVADQISKSQVMKDLLAFLRKGDKSPEEQARTDQMLKDFTSTFASGDILKAMQMDTGFKFKRTRGNQNENAFLKDMKGRGFQAAAKEAGMSDDQIATAIGKMGAFVGSDGQKLEAMSKAAAALKLGGGTTPMTTKPTAPTTGTQAAPSPAAGGAPAVTAPMKEQVDMTETANETLATIATGTDGLHKAMRQEGIKIDRAFLKNDVSREMETAMLAALRQALYEYYLYSGITDRSQVAAAFGKAGGAKMGAAALGELMRKNPAGGPEGTIQTMTANAAGGVVTGINGGLAQVTAAAGEGLASVGRGERIVPAGAGGGGNPIYLNVNGIGGRDLANFLEGKVVEGIREFKRREKFD